eukprot:1863592-Amphidinium_carterae.1
MTEGSEKYVFAGLLEVQDKEVEWVLHEADVFGARCTIQNYWVRCTLRNGSEEGFALQFSSAGMNSSIEQLSCVVDVHICTRTDHTTETNPMPKGWSMRATAWRDLCSGGASLVRIDSQR